MKAVPQSGIPAVRQPCWTWASGEPFHLQFANVQLNAVWKYRIEPESAKAQKKAQRKAQRKMQLRFDGRRWFFPLHRRSQDCSAPSCLPRLSDTFSFPDSPKKRSSFFGLPYFRALPLLFCALPIFSATPNLQPTLSAISDITILEDSAMQGIALSGISDGGDSVAQTLTITAVSSNPAILLNSSVVYTSPSATATLLLVPVSDQFGTATVTVTVQDNGGTIGGSSDTVVRTFIVTILPVNDPPLMDVLTDRTIPEDSSLQTVALSNVRSGPANEASQSLTITAVSSRPDLIPNPSVVYTSPASSGSLTFTPAPHVSGVATILLTMTDNGGTPNGGLAVTNLTFTVTVSAIPHTPVVVTNIPLTLAIGASAVIPRSLLEVTDYGPAAQLSYTVQTLPTVGNVRLNGSTLGIGGTFTQADINSGLLLYRHTGLGGGTDSFTFTVTNAENNSLSATSYTISINGSPATTIPVVTLPGSDVTWVQGGGPLILDNGATVSDTSGTLVGGTLTVSVVGNSGTGDVLSIRSVGTGIGQINVSGSVVTYEGSTIGTVSGGVGTALSVSLAGTATPASVEELVRNFRFNNISSGPSGATRTVQMVLVNGTSGASAPVTTDVLMQLVNQSPFVALPKVTVAYLEASGAAVLDNTATVSDADSPTFTGGSLVATWTANATTDDFLAIRNEGVGVNQILVSGSAVSWNGSQIATVSGGSAGTALTLAFTAAATPAAVQAALRNLTFDNQSPTPSLALRQLSVTVSDGVGGISAAAILTVVVQASDDSPVVTLPSPATTWLQGSAEQVMDALAVATDVDDVVFDTGLLVAEFTSGVTADDRLTISSEGSGVGQIDVVGTDARYGGAIIGIVTGPGTISSGLVVRLNSSATVAATQALLRRLAFSNVGVPPVTGVRTVRVYLTDGSGGTSLPVTTTINVQAINVAPIVTLPTAAVAWTEHASPSLIDSAATVSDSDSASLNGGTMVVTLTGAVVGDDISIRSVGVGAGQVSVSGSTIMVSGVSVGSFVGGTGVTPLTISFTAQGTPAVAQAILREIQFQHFGQFTAVETRTVSVTVADGIDPSAAASALITLTPVDDPPTTSAVTLATVVDVPVTGTLPGTDPEGGVLTWELVTYPITGTLTLDNVNTGAVTYTPASGQSTDDTFTFRVSDGVTWSSPAIGTVRITARLAAVRPLIISCPPREAVIGATYTYVMTAALNALPPGADLRYLVVGAPAGATVTITRITATTATLTWDQTGAPDTHRQVGVLVSDATTGTAIYQAIHVFWLAVTPGGAG